MLKDIYLKFLWIFLFIWLRQQMLQKLLENAYKYFVFNRIVSPVGLTK